MRQGNVSLLESLVTQKYYCNIKKKVFILKKNVFDKIKFIYTLNFKNKIIEKSIVNYLKLLMEGFYNWKILSLKKGIKLKIIKKKNWYEKKYSKKKWYVKTVFSNYNFSFRLNKSMRDSIKNIKLWPKNILWLIDYNIKKVFDNINKNRLLNLLTKHFQDFNLNILIKTILSCGTTVDKPFFYKTKFLQNSLLFPFLLSIYLHEFDTFMELLIQQNQSFENLNTKWLINKKYNKIFKNFYTFKIFFRLKKYKNSETIQTMIIQFKEYQYKKAKNILYVRYVNSFLIGIVGSKEFAFKIKNEINEFLKSNLHLQIKKNNMINRNNKSLLFLGFLIKLFYTFYDKSKIISTKKKTALRYKKKLIVKMSNLNIRITKNLRLSFLKYLNKAVDIQKNKIINKKNINILSQQIISEINMSKLSIKVKFFFLNIKYLKQKLNSLNSVNLHQIVKLFRAMPIRYKKKNKFLMSIELLKLKTKFFEILEKFQNRLYESIYKNKKKYFLNNFENRKFLKGRQKNFNFFCIKKTIKLDNIFQNILLTKNNVFLLRFINVPISIIVNKLRLKGFFHLIKNRIRSNRFIINLKNQEIVTCYSKIINTLFNYYNLTDNFFNIKTIVTQLKLSCIYTLAYKHNKSKYWVYSIFGENCTILNSNIKFLIELPNNSCNKNKCMKYPKLFTKTNVNFEINKILNKY